MATKQLCAYRRAGRSPAQPRIRSDEVTNRFVENLREQEAALLGATVARTLRSPPPTGAPSTSIAECCARAAWWQGGLRSCPPPATWSVGQHFKGRHNDLLHSARPDPVLQSRSNGIFIVKHLDERCGGRRSRSSQWSKVFICPSPPTWPWLSPSPVGSMVPNFSQSHGDGRQTPAPNRRCLGTPVQRRQQP